MHPLRFSSMNDMTHLVSDLVSKLMLMNEGLVLRDVRECTTEHLGLCGFFERILTGNQAMKTGLRVNSSTFL